MNDVNNNGRDPELDLLIAPLRDKQPTDEMKSRWKAAIAGDLRSSEQKRTSSGTGTNYRRITEWLVAASIGFILASAISKFQPDNQKQDCTTEIFAGIDATEMRLIAKSY